jgi:hypothetical protein
MNARDELTTLILGKTAPRAADAILEAGYRKPRAITTYEELAALFAADVNAVVMDEDGVVLQNLAGGWKSPGSDMFMHSDLAFHVYGPTFTVLHEGGVA